MASRSLHHQHQPQARPLVTAGNLLQSDNKILLSFDRCHNHIVSYLIVAKVDLL